MVNFVFFLELFVMSIILVAMVLLLAGDGAREQKLMAYILCGSLVQNAGYCLELTASSMDVAVAAVKIENLGSMFIPLCYCWFIYQYSYVKPPKKFLKLLAVLEFVMLPIIIFSDKHKLFYQGMDWLSTEYGHHYLGIEYGPFYYLFLFVRFMIPYFLSIYALFRAVRSQAYRAAARQYKAMLGISMLPVIALLSYALKLVQIFDPAPLVLGLSLASVEILVWSRRNYEFRRLASDVVLSSMGDGVIALDEQKRLVAYNRAAAGIFTKLGDYRMGEHMDSLEHFREEMLEENASQNFEINGRYYESHAKQILDESGKHQGYVVLVLDVTDTRNYIEEIKRVRQQAEDANRAKSDFLANMSHEIRTPINVILGMDEMILRENKDRQIEEYAKSIQTAGSSLLYLINDVLDISKIEFGKLEIMENVYETSSFIHDCHIMINERAEKKGLQFSIDCSETLPSRLKGDEVRLRQIVINLLSNAVKYTEKGSVNFSVEGRYEQEQFLLVLTVKDTGAGIKEENIDQLFSQFVRLDLSKNRNIEGTGLGLAITKQLLDLMHGDIQVQSVYGEGSTFTVSVPQQIVDKTPIGDFKERFRDVSRKNERYHQSFEAPEARVLVVDDMAVNLKVIVSLLKATKVRADTAKSGAQCLAMVEKKAYDIIFMDHMMPEMDGVETYRKMKESEGSLNKNTPVIMLTANAIVGVREQYLQDGFADYLSKPISGEKLEKMILKYLPSDKIRTDFSEAEEAGREE